MEIEFLDFLTNLDSNRFLPLIQSSKIFQYLKENKIYCIILESLLFINGIFKLNINKEVWIFVRACLAIKSNYEFLNN